MELLIDQLRVLSLFDERQSLAFQRVGLTVRYNWIEW